MRASLWIAWRELLDRKASFVMAVAAMALVVALCAATELVSRAREVAVSAEMDQMGPGIRLVPAGVTASDLARFNVGTRFLKAEIVAQLGRDLTHWIRATEVRLLLVQEVRGLRTALVGVEPRTVVTHADLLRNLGNGQIVIGIQLADRLSLREGSMMRLRGSEFRVAAVLPSTATTDDLAVFMPLRNLQELTGVGNVVNEIRLYPLPGNSLEKARAFLKSQRPDLKVIVPDRDDAARLDIDQSLQQHRWAVYLVMAGITAFCVLIWAHLNAGERRVEMATIVAVGGSGLSIFAILALRASIVGLVGALLGYLAAAVFTLLQDYQSVVAVVFSGYFLATLVAGAVSLSVIGALPVSLASALREHVRALQE
jgi:ABC-type lipoprotein release transport system permease subunit